LPQDPGAGAESTIVTLRTSPFALPERLSTKQDPTLIAADERHFARIADSLERSIAELSEQLDAERLAAAGELGEAVERDARIRRLSARLRTLGRYGLDLTLGRMVGAEHPDPVYIGRLGLTDADGERLLVDWRSPAAEAFFGATHANPMGLTSRRRYRWTGGRITDYWDEVFAPELLDGDAGTAALAALDDQSAFIASLGASRSSRMRDVLGTIQADQDAIIRAGSRGALVVDGGPGTGKTVVALHRSAYLLYSDQRISRHGSGLLFVGPSPGYLAYVADVLPSLGEEGVQLSTLRGLVEEGSTAGVESDPEVAALKASAELTKAVETAVRGRETPSADGLTVETPWAEVEIGAAAWAEAFDAVEPGMPHNDARDQVWDALLEIVADQLDDEVPEDQLRRALEHDEEFRTAFDRAWPLLDPVGLVAHFWSSPAFLRSCAPWLSTDEVYALQRDDARAWTVSDLPLLDAARQRIGDPEGWRRRRQRDAVIASEREGIARVVADLIAADDGEGMVQMLRAPDAQVLQDTLIDEGALPAIAPDLLAGPFAHIVVDEAQELTDAEWGMLLSRCPSRSFTIVGDRAQARHGFTESWQERLARIGLEHVEVASLTINYRTPEEVMAEAEPVIRSVLPDANVPVSIRSSGIPVRYGSIDELGDILGSWLGEHADGIACVIAAESAGPGVWAEPGGSGAFGSRVRTLTPVLAKGLEFDLVVLVDPEGFGTGVEGAVDRYVAMTRATQQLVVLQG
jgi:hypothetical protein